MKKNIYCLLVAVLMSSVMYAQKTSLTVDSQTPGWLSSMINYEDQLSVKNLTVSGYINTEDLKFMGTLISGKSLKHLDLSEANIVYDNPNNNNTLKESTFAATGHMDFLSLPISLEETTHCFGYSTATYSSKYFLKVDTLEVGGKSMNVIEKGAFSFTNGRNSNCDIKHLILREGVDSIADYAFGKSTSNGVTPQLRSVSFPSTMKYIGKQAFYNCDSLFLSPIILPDSIEEIQREAFYSDNMEPLDTIILPKNLRSYTTSAFKWKNEQVIYLSENIETIENWIRYSGSSWDDYYDVWGYMVKNVEIHLKATTPPQITHTEYSSKYSLSHGLALEGCTAYVPVGCKDLYESTGYWKYATIIEEIFVEEISLNCSNKMYVGDKQQPMVTIIPSNALNQKVKWNSSDENVLTVSANGEIAAVSPGEATIKVTSEDGGHTDSVKISVYEHTTGIELQEQLKIKVGDHIKLSATTLPLNTSDGSVHWESDDEYIATIDNKGVVYGVKQGNCVVKAKSVDGGYTAECVVTVEQPVAQLLLAEHNISLNVGESRKLSATVLPTNADNKSLVWSSSNSEVVTVNENGEIEALQAGNAYIKVVSVDNPSALDSCLVSVVQPTTGITLSYVNYTFNAIGESVQLTATVLPENATNKNVKWASSNESICIVNNGLVIGVGEGTAVIISTTEDGGHMATCIITVKNKEYLLTYVLDGKVYHTESLAEGEVITPLEEPTKEGYTFSGWSEIPGTMPADNVTITGTFTVNQYNVTFMIDGAEFATVAVNYGESIAIPEVPAREGYTFAWTDEIPETMPAKDIIINGAYSIIDGVSDVVVENEILYIYTLDGLRVNKLRQGLNLVRMKDGNVRKVFVK